MFERFGLPEILVVLVIVLLLFGPSRLSGVFKELGTGIREFKKGLREDAPPEGPARDSVSLPSVKGQEKKLP